MQRYGRRITVRPGHAATRSRYGTLQSPPLAMTDDETTRTDQHTAWERERAADLPVLTVVHHPEPPLVGARHVLRDGEAIVLGRGGELFAPGVLDDGRMSRRHLEIRRRGEQVQATDLGSHNGSFVNGERITVCALAPGDAVAIGGMILLLHHGPVFHERPRHPTLRGIGAGIARVIRQLERAAPLDVTVLVQGETGVGKELVAQALHTASGRPGTFVPVNCGALAEGVLHSEIFGHERGAFSGAGAARAGLVEAARGGTLFLDEIGDAPASLQAALLRLLESGEYRPVGSDRVLRSDARFVAATNVSLRPAVEQQRFRRDLFGRLHRVVVPVLPLRERPEDILPLGQLFAERLAGPGVSLSRPLALALLRHDWPENVRELSAVIEQAVVEAGGPGPLLLSSSLAERLQPASRVAPSAPTGAQRPSAEQLRARLAALDGNVKALADELGVARTTLYRWLRAAGIDPQALRS